MRRRTWQRRGASLLLPGLLAGCSGVQSILAPAGTDAAFLSNLFWVMLAGAVVLWFFMNGLMVYVWRVNVGHMSSRKAEALIIGGGIVFPTVVIGVLLSVALNAMPDMRAQGTGTRLMVTGEQWWWRVEYWPEGAEAPIVSANEIVLPANSRSEIGLTADKVIHSFWVPALGGKTDMFPGRETRMSLEPLKPGTYRGQCTEFCGESHAWMAFNTVVLPQDEYDAWLEAQAEPAAAPASEAAERGQAVFLSEGCGACHAVRGTAAAGKVGPDLTHLGARTSLAAGTLPMTQDALVRWVRDAKAVKPGAEMPAYDHLTEDELSDLAAYLEGLT
ncbi:cytochrome c oxidase subunit II [Roseivivax marinus]|uniref:cytochrome c oxidase subunit II n=1 Tax=Roseivivax marinus TaxID=1379903 RepID=UPI001F0450B4|nr:cytochrome c oxidase subunit II [Roseivivax marinus]UMA66571.1 cytochrome c oxidase subunit II [Roseivivax marinus]